MSSADNTVLRVRKEHRLAVGCQDTKRKTRRSGDHGIGFEGFSGWSFKRDSARGMRLMNAHQSFGCDTQALSDACPVNQDRFALIG